MKRILWTVVAATLVVSVAACSSSKKSTKKSTAATSPPTSTATKNSPSDTTSAGSVPTEAQLQAALLTAADVGTGFTARTYTRTNTSPPCAAAGSPSFRQLTSPPVDAGAKLVHATPRAVLNEVVFVYADAATAQAAFAVGKTGLDCATGTVIYSDGTKGSVTITPSVDVSTEVGADTAVAWHLTNADLKASQVVSVVGQAIIALTFSAAAAADTTTLPRPLDIMKNAVTKLKAASGGH